MVENEPNITSRIKASNLAEKFVLANLLRKKLALFENPLLTHVSARKKGGGGECIEHFQLVPQ